MLHSKALKDLELPWWKNNIVYDVYHKLIGRPLKRIEHHLGYLKVLKNDYDWEAYSIYNILSYKLQRVEKALQNGNAEQLEVHMKALALAIKLSNKIKEDNYHAAYDRHTKKWGELITWSEPTDNPELFTWKSKRPNANTEEEKQQEIKEFLIACEVDDKRQSRDTKIFFNILAKYIPTWWD
jgi:hypothetical protein